MKNALHGGLAASYARVAEANTARLQAQHEANAASAVDDGYHVPADDGYRIGNDGSSGLSQDRTGWAELLRQVTTGTAGFDRVYVQDATRIGRWSPCVVADYVALFREHDVELVVIADRSRGGAG